MLLEEALGNHTWSIHLVGRGTTNAPALPPLERLEQDATAYLRRGGSGSGSGSGQDQAGDYVKCAWLTVSAGGDDGAPSLPLSSSKSGREESEDEAAAATSIAPAGRKRRRIDDNDHQQQHDDDYHLCVDVFLNEEWSATVIFCYYDGRPTINNTTSDALFDLCLSRGRNKSTAAIIERILQWMSTAGGCYMGCKPLSLPSTDLVSVVPAVAGDATAEAMLLSQQQDDDDDDDDTTTTRKTESSSAVPNAPLVLTYKTQQTMPGIDTLALTVPPNALSQLCRAIEKEQQKSHQSHNNDDGSACSADAPNDSDDLETVEAPTTALPIVKAIECFVLEHFGMDATQLRLCQIATSTLTLGCDGRCQLHHSALALPAVRDIVVRHSRERRHCCGVAVRTSPR